MGSKNLKEKLKRIRNSGKTKNFLVFLVFVVIATFFWLFMVMNETNQSAYQIPVEIVDVPDSVTFISDLPESVHIIIKDKGFNLMRYSYLKKSGIKLKFNDYAKGDRFLVTRQDLSSVLKNIFGSQTVIMNFSPDSIRVNYTFGVGEKFPVIPVYSIDCMPGMTLSGSPKLSVDSVTVFSMAPLDTVTAIYTERIVLKGVDKPKTVIANFVQKPGMRIIPDKVQVTFDVEQLVKKTTEVAIRADYIPEGQDILFFPSRVKVSYFVPMNKYSDMNDDIEVTASFREAEESSTDKVSVKVTKYAPYMKNIELPTDSVEYTLVRGD